MVSQIQTAKAMMKQECTRLLLTSTQPSRGRGRGMLVMMAAFIFFILAMVVPLSIQHRSKDIPTYTPDPYSNDNPTHNNDNPTPSPESPIATTTPPSEYTYSVLPKIDDDDSISNSRDEFSYLRPPHSTPPRPPHSLPPIRSPTFVPTFLDSKKTAGTGSHAPSELEPTSSSNEEFSTAPSKAPSHSPSAQPSSQPSSMPSNAPTSSPSDTSSESTFIPGLLTHMEHGLLLSQGLTARILASSGTKVEYQDGSLSTLKFHGMPDFGATFADTRAGNPGGWVYVSNSEMETSGAGGVGSVTFDAQGNVLRYERLLNGTTMNCGGGKTPWNTWISCEETNGGRNYQVDPMGNLPADPITLGKEGGHWESFAFDISDLGAPQFFVTEDAERGALQRFTPRNFTWDPPGEAWKMLHGPGTIEYLMLNPNTAKTGGTFSWVTSRGNARANARQYYPNSEGIDVHESRLYFVCKKIKQMFELDLVEMTYTNQSTTVGLFDGGPDQLARILVEGADDFLFFTEEGGNDAGIHGRDATGLFFTVLESPKYIDETSGLAFSPDAKHLYVAYQKNGLLFDVTRVDRLPFHAKSLNVKYHAN